jgi:hypothetical protein
MDSMRKRDLELDLERDKDRHWQDGDLLSRLYGLAPEGGAPDEHLTSCGECSGRWEALRLARAETLSEAGIGLVPETRLLEQRRALWARIDHPHRFWFSKWAPVAATAVMLAAGIVLVHPARPISAPDPQARSQTAANAAASISDAELFSDLSTMASPAAPQAAEPIRGLFENSSSEEEGSF